MTSVPRWVVDTNVLVSAILWQGTPGRVIELASDGEVALFTTLELLDELAATLSKPKLAPFVSGTGLTVEAMLLHYQRLVTLVTPGRLSRKVSRDADDDHVLACALAANANLVVSGDGDLLSLDTFGGIRIVSVAHAVESFRS